MMRSLVLTLLLYFTCQCAAKNSFRLPPLPYKYNALEPHISQQTLEIHHGKHHAKYLNTMNAMIANLERVEGVSLEDIVKDAYKWNKPLFKNAAQCWNHAFYWKCMTPNHQPPSDYLVDEISKVFGNFAKFRLAFAKAGNSAFGSGWAWLVYDQSDDKLLVVNTIGADNPMAQNDNHVPLLTMDVWEHAYYLDYQNKRNVYVDTFLDKLVDWKFVEDNLKNAKTRASEGEL